MSFSANLRKKSLDNGRGRGLDTIQWNQWFVCLITPLRAGALPRAAQEHCLWFRREKMGSRMYPLYEAEMERRLAEKLAQGLTEDEALEQMQEEDDAADRSPY